jgi:hypothetical protein
MMNPQRILSQLRRRRISITQILLLLSLAAVCGVGVAPSTAQSTKEEREIEDRVPAHLPIKVKIKNIERVKDLKNEDWLGDLEVEVTNTGMKPIYYIYFALSLPDVITEDGTNIGFILRYGRVRLADLSTPLQSEDVPILPKESVTLKVPGNHTKAWKSFRAKGKLSNPKKLWLRVQLINFGDGTGLWTPEGIALPRTKEQSSNIRCKDETIGSTNALLTYTDRQVYSFS